MKNVICEQLPSLSSEEIEMVVGGRRSGGCSSRPRRGGCGTKNSGRTNGGCNSRSR